MSSNRWSIASAKAELSNVVRRAQRAPQMLENRGEPVAVVLALNDYQRLSAHERTSVRWKAFLALSESLGDDGAELDLPPRRSRPAPFSKRR